MYQAVGAPTLPAAIETPRIARGEAEAAAPGASPAVRWAVFLALLALTAFGAYAHIFSFFAFWDDEGFMMLTVRHFVDGYPLYDDVVSAYGPAYYLYKWLLHGVAGLPLTHDVVRANTVVFLALTAGACFAIVLGLTRSLPLAALVQVAVVFQLRNYRNEPGHPHEFGTILVALLVLAAVVWGERRRRLAAVLLGVLAGALVATKINVGIFAGAAAWVALLATTRRGAAAKVLYGLTLAAAFLLPWALMRQNLQNGWVQRFAAASVACVVAATGVALARGDRRGSLADLVLYVGSSLLAVAALCLFVVARGSTPQGLYFCLIVIPARFSEYFVSDPPQVGWRAVEVWAFVAVSVAAAVVLAPRYAAVESSARLARRREVALVVGKVLFLVVVTALWGLLRPVQLIGYAAPFLWVALIPLGRAAGKGAAAGAGPGAGEEGGLSLGRLVLGMMAGFQTLQAYPVAGSQRGPATFLLLPVAAVALHDVLRWWAGVPRPSAATAPAAWPRLARPVAAAGVVLAVLLAVAGAAQRYAYYRGQVPLDLPGARRLRVSEAQARQYRDLVAALRDKDRFFTTTGLNSLYFWTEKKPPTRLVLTHEVRQFPVERLKGTVDAVLAHGRSCVVAGGRSIAYTPPYPPFHGYIEEHFVPTTRVGDYVLMEPKRPASGVPASGPASGAEAEPGRGR